MQKPVEKVVWDEERQTLFLDGLPVALSVLLAVVNPNCRLLWRFVRQEDSIVAVPFSEQHVIWLDKKMEPEPRE